MTYYDSCYDTSKLHDVDKQWEYYKSYATTTNYDKGIDLTGMIYVIIH